MKIAHDDIVEVFWDYLKKDPDHKDRRRTSWGTKTEVGLVATVKRLGLAAAHEELREVHNTLQFCNDWAQDNSIEVRDISEQGLKALAPLLDN